MMQDYGRTQELVTAANNSAGASQEQFDKTLESLKSKLENLNTAWQEFSMGILESDLVKMGVDILTKFLTIVNKATDSFNGLWGSITKILTVVSLFKLATKLFDKIKQPLLNMYQSIIATSYKAAVEATKQYKKGAEDAAKDDGADGDKKDGDKKKRRTAKEWVSDVTGNTEFREVYEERKRRKGILTNSQIKAEGAAESLRQAEVHHDIAAGGQKVAEERARLAAEEEAKAQQEYERAKSKKRYSGDKQGNAKKDAAEAAAAQKVAAAQKKRANAENEVAEAVKRTQDAEMKVAKATEANTEATEELNSAQENMSKMGQDSWEKMGQGIQKVGAAVTGIGVGLSMLGGWLESIGLEEFGEGMSKLGSVLTVVGAGISFIGMIAPPILSALTAQGFTLQAAFWPFLIIAAALAAIVGLVVGIVALFKQAEAAKLENRMKAAAEATEEAREAAEGAKEAYDNLIGNRSEYEDMQKTLEDLTYGTKEWKSALAEANQQVLALIQTYPQLAKYLGRGEDGQLIIKDEGWDAMIESQEKAIRNAQAVLSANQLYELELKEEGAVEDFYDTTKLEGEGKTVKRALIGPIYDVIEESLLHAEFDKIYASGGGLEDIINQADKLADKYGATTDSLIEAAKAYENTANTLYSVQQQEEAIARANLAARASDMVMESGYSDEIIDAFAKSQTSDTYLNKIESRAKEVYKDDKKTDADTNEHFKALVKEYGIEDQMNNDELHNLQELYKAMAGVEEIPDGIEESKTALADAIAKMDVANQTDKAMDKYASMLGRVDKSDRNNIAGIFSQSGKGMTVEFANQLLDSLNSGNREFLKNYAAEMGVSITDWADTMGKTIEEFYAEAEENATAAIKAKTKAFEKLNKALDRTSDEISVLEKQANLSAGQMETLANKLVNVVSTSGQEAGEQVEALLGTVLEQAGDKSDELANYLSAMVWQDETAWEKLPEALVAMNIEITPELENFIVTAKEAAGAIRIINFKTFNQDIQSVYETLKQFKSGELGRELGQEQYDSIIRNNAELKGDFIQIGDKFIYLGESIQDLITAVEKNTIALLGDASLQLDRQIGISNMLYNMEEEGSISMTSNPNDLENYELRDLLYQIQMETYEQYGRTDKDILSSVSYNGKSLDISFDTNFYDDDLDRDTLIKMLSGFQELYNNRADLLLSGTEAQENGIISGLVANNSAEFNASEAQKLMGTAEGTRYAKAFITQAIQSGLVNEAVIGEYSSLIEKENLTEEEKEQLEKLEKSMITGINRAIKNQEGQAAILELESQALEALKEQQQKQIDELSQINDSIVEAQQKMINKIQEQIDDERQARDNEKAERSIADKEARLAYLRADSGANASEIVSLEKEIAEERQNYQDTLIDQALQNLEDSNEKAAEQRQEQIKLLQAQLDIQLENGTLSAKAAKIVASSLAQVNRGVDLFDTPLGKLIRGQAEWSGKTPNERSQAISSLASTVTTAVNAKSHANVSSSSDSGSSSKPQTTGVSQTITNGVLAMQKKATFLRKAVDSGVDALFETGDWDDRENNEKYIQAKNSYVEAGGVQEDFEDAVKDKFKEKYKDTGKFEGWQVKGINDDYDGYKHAYKGGWDDELEIVNSQGETIATKLSARPYISELSHDSAKTRKDIEPDVYGEVLEDPPASGTLVMHKGTPYVFYATYHGGLWAKLKQFSKGEESASETPVTPSGLVTAMRMHLNAYATGGLADFTGPAWLDGTKSRPELVLNQTDTANFIKLKDVLADFMSDSPRHGSEGGQGDNYYDIEINVDSLSDDYDVEQLAEKIREMIHQDAMYRNVNSVSLSR